MNGCGDERPVLFKRKDLFIPLGGLPDNETSWAAMIWEYTRECTPVCNLARTLKHELKDGPQGKEMDSSVFDSLVEEARRCRYLYRSYLYPDRGPEQRRWYAHLFRIVAELDAIMPEIDWRFILGPEFPAKPFWSVQTGQSLPAKRP